MLTLTSQYALKALIYLVRQTNGYPVAGPRIARDTKIPAKYLSMVLRELVRANVLESACGKGGGFRMARPARQVSLLEVVAPFEVKFSAKQTCPFGNEQCSDDNPCLAHNQWKTVIENERRFLQRTSVYDVAVPRNGTSTKHRKKKQSKKKKKRTRS